MAIDRMIAERAARILILILALGAGAMALAFRFFKNPGVIEIHAAMPDKGGWLTSSITTQIDEPLNLRLVSDDVVHSFALGQSDFEPVDVLPGKPTDVTLVFDDPGTYTFYCTRWCGEDHWRMRGTITVIGDRSVNTGTPAPPLYLKLGIDLDAPHEVFDLDLTRPPSAERGASLGVTLPLEFLSQENYQENSPYQVWKDMRSAAFTTNLSDEQVWDLVAWTWQQATTPEKLADGQFLYQRDCAACHGVEGTGEGIFGTQESNSMDDPTETGPDVHSLEAPTNFQDTDHMLGASPALLQGKILRGGMGTGMPSWGLLYTEAQTWDLVDYLWTFVFQYSLE